METPATLFLIAGGKVVGHYEGAPSPAALGDLLADGVVDPVKVTKAALANAASVASLVLTTQSAVVEAPADEEPAAGHDHGHGHSH